LTIFACSIVFLGDMCVLGKHFHFLFVPLLIFIINVGFYRFIWILFEPLKGIELLSCIVVIIINAVLYIRALLRFYSLWLPCLLYGLFILFLSGHWSLILCSFLQFLILKCLSARHGLLVFEFSLLFINFSPREWSYSCINVVLICTFISRSALLLNTYSLSNLVRLVKIILGTHGITFIRVLDIDVWQRTFFRNLFCFNLKIKKAVIRRVELVFL
jgi:hypothetical protein